MMTKKILFLHGFFASGSCIPAQALRQAFTGEAEVLTPDLPLHPKEALAFIENICKQEKPCVLVGNSNGAFLALRKTYYFVLLIENKGLTKIVSLTGNDLETSGLLYSAMFCINQKNAFLICKGSVFLFHCQSYSSEK